MRALILILLTSAVGFAQTPTPRQEIENVAAFARLYGVVRYFYPSDAAAATDWNRFAVYGVSRVRRAPNPTALETTLEELFTPLGPGIEIASILSAPQARGALDASLVAWRYRGAGFSTLPGRTYWMKRTNRSVPTAADANQMAVLGQTVLVDSLRGKAIRLRGRMRVLDPNVSGWAGLWLRVDRGQQGVGFFDNMQNRPVRDTAWREYVIEGTIAADATKLVFGALAVGVISADVDALDLAFRAGGGAWTPFVIADPGFEADAASSGWSQTSASQAASFTRPGEGAAQGRQFQRMTLAPPKSSPASPSSPSDPFEIPVAGAFVDVDLAPRLRARVPLALSDSQARSTAPSMSAFTAAVRSVVDPAGRDNLDVRLADVVVAWNVFRHFYPYWPETQVDWDAGLMSQLDVAMRAEETRSGHWNAVRALVADARDGHGGVTDVMRRDRQGVLPLQLKVVEGKLVVIASRVPEARIGAVVTAIDGANAAERFALETRLGSGTPQWRASRAAWALTSCPLGSVVKLTLEYPLEPTRDAAVSCGTGRPPTEPRPDSIVELEPGIWYVDITRAQMAQIAPMLQTLASAKGIVFDSRGYPTDAGAAILPYLIDAVENDRWMHIANIAGPFGQVSEWNSLGWNLRPAQPHFSGKRVVLTDGRAISYAESVMGYVRDLKLATIIGGTTAGTNGNIAMFAVPGGFQIVLTGMRVTRHDGVSPYHLVGVPPDILLEPTLVGLRGGKDELLERALAVLRASKSVP